ncbi:FG-GAP-like repeat-containing protein [Streptomyces sp. NPDC059639]|uniref:FG-GAP-like repeat-containing protein n=1 Tax=Streptomyces sp. NPDC059639 TaxID=3346891 RepID=UPI003678070E
MRVRTLSATAAVVAVTAAGLTLPLAGTSAAAAAATPLHADFNGDGLTDLAVGVPSATVNGKANAGYVNVVWGGVNGLGPSSSTGVISQSYRAVPGTPEAGDRFGSAVASGDLNGDGISDLVIGASGEALTDSGRGHEGSVTVLYGSPSGFGNHDSVGFTAARGEGEFTQLGSRISVGDYDHDGDQDLALGAADEESGSLRLRPGPLTPGSPTTTEVIAQYSMGGRTRDLATGDFDGDGKDDLAVTYKEMEGAGTFILRWNAAGEPARYWNSSDYGQSLAAADFDRDGKDDLAIGYDQPNPEVEDAGLCTDERSGGAVAVVYGEGESFGASHDCFTQDSPGVAGASEAGDWFGFSVAAGDVNGDDLPELVVGVPGEDIGTVKDAGAYVVLRGTATGPSGGVARNQNTPDMPGTAETGDQFGAQVTTGRYNPDQLDDVAASAPTENAGEARSGGVWYAQSTQTAYPLGRSLTPFGLALSTGTKYGEVLGE